MNENFFLNYWIIYWFILNLNILEERELKLMKMVDKINCLL